MSKKDLTIKPITAAVGFAFVSGVALSGAAVADQAADSPFAAADLDSGFMLAGGDKHKEGKCGEGKCGEDKERGEEGSCGEDDHGEGEGSCGEGEGSCGGDKGEEGKCGEGKCGGAA